jgi:hypothetical protein
MRGYIFMLEAVFASLILVGFLLYLAGSSVPAGSDPERDFGSILRTLDLQDVLRGPASIGDLQGISDQITIPGFNHSVRICDPSGSCTGSIPEARNIWASSYFISGDGSYNPWEVRLYVWEA